MLELEECDFFQGSNLRFQFKGYKYIIMAISLQMLTVNLHFKFDFKASLSQNRVKLNNLLKNEVEMFLMA